jgi:TPR repeat protein
MLFNAGIVIQSYIMKSRILGFGLVLPLLSLTILLGGCSESPEAKLKAEFEGYRVKATQGDANAQSKMGECYHDAKGVAKDLVEAVKWWRKAAEQGNPDGQHFLGICYAKGDGVDADRDEAIKWIHRSADQGNVFDQYTMGELCGYTSDPNQVVEAIKWWRKAAEQGHAHSYFSLGTIYAVGRGPVRSDQFEADKYFSGAVKLWRKAAESGDADGQSQLGYCYQLGAGVPKDKVEAAAFYSLAGAKLESARTYLAKLEETMPPEEISRVQQRAMGLRREFDEKLAANRAEATKSAIK